MKSALITWFHYENYGTALQVSALSNTIKKLGHDVNVINYLPVNCGKSVRDYSFKSWVQDYINSKKEVITISKKKHYVTAEKTTIFENFLKDKLSFTNKCTTYSDLCELCDTYDAFVCGSDQIWSPNNFDPHYFLDFVSNPNKIIAYAPSIGLKNIEDRYVREKMIALISRFKHLSIREEHGKKLIKKLTGRDAKLVLDPTLLMTGDEWRAFCDVKRSKVDKPYILAYMLGSNNEHWRIIEKIRSERDFDLKIVPVFDEDLERNGCIRTPVGPKEFLSLIDNADIVCTDSFHGMVFSLLFHKLFIPFVRFHDLDPLNQNSRVFNLLSVIGEEQRLIGYNGGIPVFEEYDYTTIDTVVGSFRKESFDYLTNAFSEVESHKTMKKQHVLENCTLCCGCGSCVEVCATSAISVSLNSKGFLKADVDDSKCVKCGKCVDVCPFCGDAQGVMIKDSLLYSYKDYDKDVLNESSSGGFAYALSKVLLEDGFSVVGCAYDKKTQSAKHILVDFLDDLPLLQGSKYIQSDFSNVLPDILSCNKPLAIFGTPCQIAGAKKLLKNRDDVLYIDLICHGVPSYNLYSKYISYISKEYGLKENKIFTKFRFKSKGWRVIRLYSSDGNNYVDFHQKEDLFFRMFESMNCYNNSCYDCRWRDRTEADIRIGDYWGDRFADDRTGVSMVSVLTDKGSKIISFLTEENCGEITQQIIDDYLKIQQCSNIPKPVYYDELIDRLADKKEKLSFIVEKYADDSKNSLHSRKDRYGMYFKYIWNDSRYKHRRKKKHDT